ncbi:MAG: hypothetical protein WCW13_01545 [archaeon]|jgi:hypothetical protein
MDKTVIVAVVFFSLIITFSGCVQQSDSNSQAQLNTSANELLGASPSSLIATQPLVCPYDCCVGTDYVNKSCSVNYVCEQNKCNPVCKEVTYFENVPKQISVPYQDTVCVDIPYQEPYQEQECHLENVIYSTTTPVVNDYWTLASGCVTEYYLNLTNTDNQVGVFQAKFDLKLQDGTIQQKTSSNSVFPGTTTKFSVSYDRSCFSQIPTLNSFSVTPSQKNVCVMVTKYRSLTRQECHMETKYRDETTYESVQKTKTVCGNELNACSQMTCNDNQECTIDSCSDSVCQYSAKPNGETCSDGLCSNGICILNKTSAVVQTCNEVECSIKSTFVCQGTTKLINKFSCQNNLCVSSNSQEANSISCGYVAGVPIPAVSIKDKVQDLFNRFTEFKLLQNGAVVNLYLIDETIDFSIMKNSSGVTVTESDVGDITMSLDDHVFNLLYSASNICSKAKELRTQGLISEYNFIQNKSQTDLVAAGYNNLISCFS